MVYTDDDESLVLDPKQPAGSKAASSQRLFEWIFISALLGVVLLVLATAIMLVIGS